MKPAPYAFYCSQCKVSHAGECQPQIAAPEPAPAQSCRLCRETAAGTVDFMTPTVHHPRCAKAPYKRVPMQTAPGGGVSGGTAIAYNNASIQMADLGEVMARNAPTREVIVSFDGKGVASSYLGASRVNISSWSMPGIATGDVMSVDTTRNEIHLRLDQGLPGGVPFQVGETVFVAP